MLRTENRQPEFLSGPKPRPPQGGVPEESEYLDAGMKQVVVSGGPDAAWALVCVRASKPPEEVVDAVILQRASMP